MFVLFFFIPYFHPLFSCFSSGLMKHFVPRERFLYLKQQNCAGMGDTSIDHLVIEKAKNIVMIEANFDWMDVGTWD
ncbi:hypothetical protein IYZ83_004995 [Wolbachia pipientis]|uniref:hypothetical protein n=1 Tax=Wolbachia pipientis TaxID=955 RepID=UPI001F2CBE77|nr:hypothetical protein [Wolbachia pipientis]UIP91484.1 hypothetical protein IYZ83_004995 [Wolbachia pipientis]